MKYFVTGATGFIGGRLARQLVEAGHEVIALARRPEAAGDLAAVGVSVSAGDITDKESLRAPMEGVDGVFHVAGWYKIGLRDKRDGKRINVEGTRNVLETMRDLGITRGVYTSSLAINGDTHGQVVDEKYDHRGPWPSEYDRTKWSAHYEVAKPMIEAGLPLVIVQPGAVYGPDDPSSLGQILRDFLKRKLPAVPKGSAICFGQVDDTATGHILAMERGTPGESYIIAGPPHTMVEALELASRITGIPPPRVRVPAGLLKGVAAFAGLVEKVMPLPPDYSAEYLRVAAGVTYLGSNAKARRELGYEPRSLEDGLPALLEYEQARLRDQKSRS